MEVKVSISQGIGGLLVPILPALKHLLAADSVRLTVTRAVRPPDARDDLELEIVTRSFPIPELLEQLASVDGDDGEFSIEIMPATDRGPRYTLSLSMEES